MQNALSMTVANNILMLSWIILNLLHALIVGNKVFCAVPNVDHVVVVQTMMNAENNLLVFTRRRTTDWVVPN